MCEDNSMQSSASVKQPLMKTFDANTGNFQLLDHKDGIESVILTFGFRITYLLKQFFDQCLRNFCCDSKIGIKDELESIMCAACACAALHCLWMVVYEHVVSAPIKEATRYITSFPRYWQIVETTSWGSFALSPHRSSRMSSVQTVLIFTGHKQILSAFDMIFFPENFWRKQCFLPKRINMFWKDSSASKAFMFVFWTQRRSIVRVKANREIWFYRAKTLVLAN